LTVIIDELGIFEGKRINRCSPAAQLYYLRLMMAANGYGRIHLDYQAIVMRCFPMWPKENIPSESEIISYFNEYWRNRLIFLYQVDGQTWGQFDVKEKTYGRYQTKADKRSPAPPAIELAKWLEENRRISAQTATVAVSPMNNSALFPNHGAKFPQAVAVAVADSCMQDAGAVAVEACARETATPAPQSSSGPIPMPASSLEPPPDAADRITQIARAHPRLEKPVETERAIVEALEGGVTGGIERPGLISQKGSASAALDYLLDRTKLYKQITDMWPPGDRDFIVGSPRWFSSGCYDEPEEVWRRRINDKTGDSKQEQRIERSVGQFAEAFTRIAASGDIPGRNGDQRLPVGNAGVRDRPVAAPVIELPARARQAGD
jgi:hypothetical protein